MTHPKSGRKTSMPRYSLVLAATASLVAACSSDVDSLSAMQENVSGLLTGEDVPVADARPVVALDAGLGPSVLAAVRGSHGYRAARAAERRAVSDIEAANSARRTQVSANANVGAVQERGDNASDLAGAAANLTISQLLYDAGESAAAINQATAKAVAAQADRINVANEVALEAARAWIDVWQYRERLGLLRSRTGEMAELLAQIERMAQNGMLDRAMLDDARRQIVSIRLEESRLQADLRDAQVRFARFFNTRDAVVARPQELISSAMARQEAMRWREAPILRRAAAETIIARNALTMAEAAFRPRARLQAGVASPMDRDDTTDTSVGVTLEYTFGDGGRRRAQLEAAQAGLEAASAELAERQLTLEAELAAAVANLDAIQRAMPLLNENIRLGQSSAETARSQIATGQSNLRQLVDAEIESYRSSDQQIAMQAERMVLQMTIAARTGALARAIGLDDATAE